MYIVFDGYVHKSFQTKFLPDSREYANPADANALRPFNLLLLFALLLLDGLHLALAGVLAVLGMI